jgi:Tfp pilus assembly protein PilN
LVVLPSDDGTAAEAAAEAAEAAGLPAGAPVREVGGALEGVRAEAGLELRRAGGASHLIAARLVDDLDVRDPAFLESRQRQERWDLRTWRAAQVAAAGLLLAGVADLAGMWLVGDADRLRAQVAADTARVRELEGLNAIAGKVEDLGRNRPLPFEMLALANVHRPAGVTFTAVAHKAGPVLEIEARTASASEVGAFEQALAADAAVAKAEMRSIQGREGVTSFSLAVTFKPEALRKAAQQAP